MSELKTLEDFYLEELKDLLSAESQITKALPRMIDAASSPDLKKAFQSHLQETENHVRRLEQISQTIGKPITGGRCKGMEGILAEGEELLHQNAEPAVKDAALIADAQKIEHYEICTYGCARTYAKLLGDSASEKLLQESLDEESSTDKKLTSIADALNPIAVEAA